MPFVQGVPNWINRGAGTSSYDPPSKPVYGDYNPNPGASQQDTGNYGGGGMLPPGVAPSPPPPPPSAPPPSPAPTTAGSGLGDASGASAAQTGFNNFLDAYKTYTGYGLDQQDRNASLDRMRGQTGMYGGVLDAQGRNLQSNFDLANRTSDLKLRAMGIDRDALGAEYANIAGQRGLVGESLANRKSIMDNSITGLENKASDQRWDIDSQATANGTALFPGRRIKTDRVNRDLANQEQAARLGYAGDEIGSRGQILNLDQRKAEADTRDKKLGMVADEVGIDKDKARSALDFGIAQLGYDKYINSNKLADMMDSSNAQERDAARKIMADAYQMYQAIQGGPMGDQMQNYLPGVR